MAEAYVESLLQLDEDSILAQLNSIAQELGIVKEIFETSRIYIHYAVFARVFGHIAQIIAQYYDNIDINNTTDEALLEQQIKPFVAKRTAKVAKVILKFSRRSNTLNQTTDVIIPRNMEITTEDDDPIIFRLAESRILWKDAYSVLIPAYSVEIGSVNNVPANTLTFFDDADFFDQIQVTNPNPAYGGSDEETAFDARQRIGLFRYGINSTRDSILEALYEHGISYYDCNLVEYYEGFGTVLICMDVDSEEQFHDIIASIDAQKPGGVRYQYAMVDYVNVNIHINLKIVIHQSYTPYERDELEGNIKDAIETFFANRIYVGRTLSINRLESYLLQYLFDEKYDIYEVDAQIENDSQLVFNETTGQLKVNEFQKLVPNLIYTTISYDLEE